MSMIIKILKNSETFSFGQDSFKGANLSSWKWWNNSWRQQNCRIAEPFFFQILQKVLKFQASLPSYGVWYCGISDLYPILSVNGSTSTQRVDDDLNCLVDVLFRGTPDTFVIIGVVVGGLGVNVLFRSLRCIYLVFNGNKATLKALRTFQFLWKSNPEKVFLKNIFLSDIIPLFTSFHFTIISQSTSYGFRVLLYNFFDNTTNKKYLLKL